MHLRSRVFRVRLPDLDSRINPAQGSALWENNRKSNCGSLRIAAAMLRDDTSVGSATFASPLRGLDFGEAFPGLRPGLKSFVPPGLSGYG